MVDPARVAKVRRLLAEGGLSKRIIAERAGVCRDVVRRIAAGIYPDYWKLRALRAMQDALELFDGRIRRCKCGARAQFLKGSDQCMECDLRELSPPRRNPRTPDAMLAALPLELKPEHRARYEAVRREKIAEENRRLAEQEPWPERDFEQVDDVDGDEITQEGKWLWPEEIPAVEDD